MTVQGLALLALSLATAAPGGVAVGTRHATCPITHAHYHLSSLPGFALRFRRIEKRKSWLSDLALELIPQTGPSYWMLFDAGSARYVDLVSTTDVTKRGWQPPDDSNGDRPLGEMHYFAWSGDADYQFDEAIPTSAAKAPERIFLPDLAEAMWYRALPRVAVRQGVFVLDGCP